MLTFLFWLLVILFILVHLDQILALLLIIGGLMVIYHVLRHWDLKRDAKNIRWLHFSKKTIWSIAAVLFVLFLIGSVNNGSSNTDPHHQTHTERQYHHVKRQVKQHLRAKKPVHKKQDSGKSHDTMGPAQKVDGTEAYCYVNHNHSTLSDHWDYDHIHYANLDHLNRTGKVTAYLDRNNVTNDHLRQEQFVEPSGWHQKRYHGRYLLNRGHEIAYSLSKGITSSGKYSPNDAAGDQNDIRNLLTQTQFSNQDVQTIFEGQVRNALESGEEVIYQVTPVFHGDNLMASGVHMQARSTNDDLNFNVYLYNIQPGVTFNYRDGTSNVHGDKFIYHPYQPHNYYHSNSLRHWSPLQREHWRQTMYNRYWRYRY